MKANPRQEVIYDTWEKEDINILVNAGAGTGKTTTLMQLLTMCKHRTLFLAFNKSIQEEIQNRIEKQGLSQGLAKTMHSLGFEALRANYSKVTVKGSKNYELLKILQEQHKSIFKKIKWKDRLPLILTLTDLNDVSRNFLTDNLKDLTEILLSMSKPMSSNKNLKFLWEELIKVRNATYEGGDISIDFIDMIYLPIRQNFTIPIYPTYLFIDEAQDLNLCQHKLIDKVISQGTIKKWCAVGDRKQAIYGFSGASSKSFDLFKTKGGEVKELPLDINYRSEASIIESANEVFDVLVPFKTDKGIVKEITEPAFIKNNSMIICRNVKPLITLYFQMLSLKKPCYIKSEDLLSGVQRMLKPYLRDTVILAKHELLNKMEKLSEKNDDDSRLQSFILKENFQIFKILVKYFATDTTIVSDLLLKIKELYVRKDNSSMLCSIHRSKGLEADVVYILNENLIPSKFATSPEQLEQEAHLKYVARTRAKKEMYFLNLKI